MAQPTCLHAPGRQAPWLSIQGSRAEWRRWGGERGGAERGWKTERESKNQLKRAEAITSWESWWMLWSNILTVSCDQTSILYLRSFISSGFLKNETEIHNYLGNHRSKSCSVNAWSSIPLFEVNLEFKIDGLSVAWPSVARRLACLLRSGIAACIQTGCSREKFQLHQGSFSFWSSMW